jgi:hypothetical protein
MFSCIAKSRSHISSSASWLAKAHAPTRTCACSVAIQQPTDRVVGKCSVLRVRTEVLLVEGLSDRATGISQTAELDARKPRRPRQRNHAPIEERRQGSDSQGGRPMPTECNSREFACLGLNSRAVTARFDGGAITSDADVTSTAERSCGDLISDTVIVVGLSKMGLVQRLFSRGREEEE